MVSSVRLQCANILNAVVSKHCSLTSALLKENIENTNLVHAWCNGVIRHYFSLSEIIKLLMKKPLKEKDHDILYLIYIALFQLRTQSAPEYAIVSETVELTKLLKKNWATGLVNAILRSYCREQKKLEAKIKMIEVAHFDHPKWLINKFKNERPDNWESLIKENNSLPRTWLRINQQKTNVDDYLKHLKQEATKNPFVPNALLLSESADVVSLPGFKEGLISVQDLAAQLAALTLELKPGLRVLDACAAPGGKTAHIAEIEPNLEKLVAIEIDPERATLIQDNFKRLKLNTSPLQIHIADATELSTWHEGQLFDRILIDAPCSGTGVIRRHPDIKLLKRESDIKNLCILQKKLLTSLWPLLKTGGILLYSTCSILLEENTKQIETFIHKVQNAELISLPQYWGVPQRCGLQLFQQQDGGDGFYIAKLRKI